MNARGLGAAFLCGGVLILAIAVRAFALAMVETWSPTLTVVVVMFAGVALIIVSIGVGAGVRLALADRRENQRPIVIQAPPHAGVFADPLRDADRLSRIEERFHRIGARGESGTIPAFETGPFVDWTEG